MITLDRDGAARLYEMLDFNCECGRADTLSRALESAAAGNFAALAELVGTREVEGADDIDERAATEAQIAFNRDSHPTEWNVSAAWLRAVVAARRVYSAGECGARRGDGIVCARAPHAGEHRDAGGMCEWEDALAPAPAPDFREGDVVFVANGTGSWTVERVAASILVRQGDNTWDANPSALTLLRRRHFRAGERCPVVAVGQVRDSLDQVCAGVFVTRQDGSGWLARCPHEDESLWATDVLAARRLAADWSAPEAVPCEVKP